jgi:hypothetical protein
LSPFFALHSFQRSHEKYKSILGHLVLDWTVKLRALRSRWLGDRWAIVEAEGLEKRRDAA